jgi:hypothetical protein
MKKIFSIHFGRDKDNAILRLGGYNPEYIKDKSNITYVKMPYKKRWEMKIGAFQVGENTTFSNGADSAFILEEPKVAVLDTFSPTIKVPSSSANQIFSLIFHGL